MQYTRTLRNSHIHGIVLSRHSIAFAMEILYGPLTALGKKVCAIDLYFSTKCDFGVAVSGPFPQEIVRFLFCFLAVITVLLSLSVA